MIDHEFDQQMEWHKREMDKQMQWAKDSFDKQMEWHREQMKYANRHAWTMWFIGLLAGFVPFLLAIAWRVL